ncbi:MAG TPA: hypothetical protein VGY56_00060 [Verrucomicrobiae bacterium]|nr:hypothetical protein [Verrucomicrobiae bacterium]
MKKLFVATLSTLAAAVCANAQNLNGTLNTGFYGSPLYVQTINTGFGNSAGGGDATGSELDAVYAKVSGSDLYLFIAGAFQNNGNHLNVFVAGGAAGQNTLNAPTTGTLKAMNGSVFYPGFQATWAFDMNDYSGTLYSEEYNLTGTPSGGYVGALAESSSGIAAGSDGGVASLYLNNTLASTMGASGTAISGATSGTNTTTGLEMVIPLSAIGYTGGAINVLIDINGGGDGYLSNQFLPGLAVGSGNLGTTTFNFGSVATPTNYVTFTLDLSEEVALGNFINGASTNSVAVGGNPLDSFGTGDQLTNYTLLNPGDLNPGLKTNWYIGTFPVVSFLPTQLQYKFRVNGLDGGYEQPISTAGGNRVTNLTQQITVLPVTSYDDLGLGDLTESNISVMFSVLVTNGTSDDTGYNFVKGSDQVYVSGAWLNWPAWGVNALPPNQQMIEVGTSDLYTNYFLIPRGTPIHMTYKYSFNGVDDENGAGTNHIREIRSYGPTYSFPQDVWSYTVLRPNNGNPYTLAGIAVTNIVEPDFGYLKIGGPSGGNYPITWLGRPFVFLQNSSGLNGPWNTLSGTDATESTNFPASGPVQFFRLMKQ